MVIISTRFCCQTIPLTVQIGRAPADAQDHPSQCVCLTSFSARWFFRYRISTPAKSELFLTTAQWQQQCRHAGFSKVAWLPQDGSPTAGMSEHIILATLPGQAVSAVTFTAPSEPVLGRA